MYFHYFYLKTWCCHTNLAHNNRNPLPPAGMEQDSNMKMRHQQQQSIRAAKQPSILRPAATDYEASTLSIWQIMSWHKSFNVTCFVHLVISLLSFAIFIFLCFLTVCGLFILNFMEDKFIKISMFHIFLCKTEDSSKK